MVPTLTCVQCVHLGNGRAREGPSALDRPASRVVWKAALAVRNPQGMSCGMADETAASRQRARPLDDRTAAVAV